MGQLRPLFCLFSFFPNTNFTEKNRRLQRDSNSDRPTTTTTAPSTNNSLLSRAFRLQRKHMCGLPIITWWGVILKIITIISFGFTTFERPENTYLLSKGRSVRSADLQFFWFGFNQTSKSVDYFNVTKLLNPNWPNRWSALQ